MIQKFGIVVRGARPTGYGPLPLVPEGANYEIVASGYDTLCGRIVATIVDQQAQGMFFRSLTLTQREEGGSHGGVELAGDDSPPSLKARLVFNDKQLIDSDEASQV